MRRFVTLLPCGGMLLLLACAVPGTPRLSRLPAADAQLVVQLEERFAAASRDRGARAAFLEYLDDESVVLQPGPVAGRAAWEAGDELSGTLDWSPDWVVMSTAGSLGFASGRWQLGPTGGEPAVEGRYLTAWRRGPAGWRVIFDGGFGRPAHGRTPLPGAAARGVASGCEPGPAVPVGELMLLDSGLSGSADRSFATRVLQRLTPEASLYHAPAVEAAGDDASRLRALQALPPSTQLRPMGGGTAVSGDLGYTYGLSAGSPEGPADASYVQLWCRRGGDWRLLLQLRTRLPEQVSRRVRPRGAPPWLGATPGFTPAGAAAGSTTARRLAVLRHDAVPGPSQIGDRVR